MFLDDLLQGLDQLRNYHYVRDEFVNVSAPRVARVSETLTNRIFAMPDRDDPWLRYSMEAADHKQAVYDEWSKIRVELAEKRYFDAEEERPKSA